MEEIKQKKEKGIKKTKKEGGRGKKDRIKE